MKLMKTNSNVKRSLSCSPRKNHVLKGTRLKLLQRTTMFSREKELLFEDMMVPWEEKNLSCSSRQFKFFLGAMIVPWENICFEFFSNHNHLIVVFI